MMVSPSYYAEVKLKGKSIEEIMTEIRSLKREINRLKREIEEAGSESEVVIVSPSPLTQIKVNREYLKEAIEAYKNAGGEYIPTKQEKRILAFNDALDDLSRIIFTIRSFCIRYSTRVVTVSDHKVLYTKTPSPAYIAANDFKDSPYTKEEFLSGLKEIYLGEWKRSYFDPGIMDGTEWELKLEFKGEHRTVSFHGCNAYPYNFEDLQELLGIDDDEE